MVSAMAGLKSEAILYFFRRLLMLASPAGYDPEPAAGSKVPDRSTKLQAGEIGQRVTGGPNHLAPANRRRSSAGVGCTWRWFGADPKLRVRPQGLADLDTHAALAVIEGRGPQPAARECVFKRQLGPAFPSSVASLVLGTGGLHIEPQPAAPAGTSAALTFRLLVCGKHPAVR